jgi:excisionase family DNA binding protein
MQSLKERQAEIHSTQIKMPAPKRTHAPRAPLVERQAAMRGRNAEAKAKLRQLAREERIPAYRPDERWRFKLDAWIKQQSSTPSASISGAALGGDDELMTIDQAAQYLDLTSDTLHMYIRQRKIVTFRSGNFRFFTKWYVQQWILDKSNPKLTPIEEAQRQMLRLRLRQGSPSNCRSCDCPICRGTDWRSMTLEQKQTEMRHRYLGY